MAADPDNTAITLTGDPIVIEASKRFRRCAEWEAVARDHFLDDLRFAHGDSDNGYQWPSMIRQNRDTDSRPCLTMNVVRQHNLQIVNEAKQNKSSVAFRATGGGASKAAADLYEAMFRRIEYVSEAQAAYKTACDFQVNAGWGYWRLVTEYENNNSFNQDFRIKRVRDPLSIYLDPDCQESNCSDAKFGFVFDLVLNEELDEAYPRLKDLRGTSPLGGLTLENGWNVKDHTRVCEYFRKVPKADRLVSFIDPTTGQRKELKKSLMPEEVYQVVMGQPLTKWRHITEYTIEWFLIVGEKVVERTNWLGKYIPIIKIVGEETVIDGVMDRKGHTRAMKDAQRMYNYNASAQVEFVALQGKTPWIAAAEAIEEYETMWNSANKVNHSVLIYKSLNDEGTEIQPPQRTQPPTASGAYDTGMETSFNQMMMTSGQWQNQMGMGGNERTGEAISRRQEQGYTAVFHYQDNFAEGLRYTGKQFLDVVPKLYDTKRLLKCQTQSGEEFDLELNPQAQQVLQQKMDQDGQVVARVLNPGLGEYDVQSDVGPAYGTRREETVKAMTLLLTQAPALVPIIGDLLLSAMDFKEATEAAARLKRMVPGQALGTGPTEAEQLMQQQIASLQEALTKALQQTGKDQLKLAGKEELRDINVYNAETNRIKALEEQLALDKAGIKSLVEQLIRDALAGTIHPIIADNSLGGRDASPS